MNSPDLDDLLYEARRGKEIEVSVTRQKSFSDEEERIKTPEISTRIKKAEELMKKLDFDTLFDDFKDHDMKGSLGKNS